MSEFMQVDPRILEHPKFIRAVRAGGSAPVHLWLGIRSWQEAHDLAPVPHDLIDEPRGPLDLKVRAEALRVLLEVGLLIDSQDGYTLHGLDQWAGYRGSVATRRYERDRKRQQRLGVRDTSGTLSGTCPESGPGHVRDICPSRSDQIRSDQIRSEGGVGGDPALVAPGPGDAFATPYDPSRVPQPKDAPAGQLPTSNAAPEPAPVPATKPRASKGAHPLPADWKPNADHADRARRFGLSLDSEAGALRDWAAGGNKRKADWDATFRNWLKNAHARLPVWRQREIAELNEKREREQQRKREDEAREQREAETEYVSLKDALAGLPLLEGLTK